MTVYPPPPSLPYAPRLLQYGTVGPIPSSGGSLWEMPDSNPGLSRLRVLSHSILEKDKLVTLKYKRRPLPAHWAEGPGSNYESWWVVWVFCWPASPPPSPLYTVECRYINNYYKQCFVFFLFYWQYTHRTCLHSVQYISSLEENCLFIYCKNSGILPPNIDITTNITYNAIEPVHKKFRGKLFYLFIARAPVFYPPI